jgi:hypothetical protein
MRRRDFITLLGGAETVTRPCIHQRADRTSDFGGKPDNICSLRVYPSLGSVLIPGLLS